MSDDEPKIKPRIKVVKDGPYIVSGNVPLDEEHIVYGHDGEPARWAEGPSFPHPETYALCRCGASKHKPFCDGSHVEAGMDGAETAQHGPEHRHIEKTTGPGVDLTWCQEICIAARFCHSGKDAWGYADASDDPEARAKAIEEAGNCPSGSLVAWDKVTGAPIEPECEPGISVIEDPTTGLSGPLWVKGGIPIESADGVEYERRNRVTLCRCGRSARKPFCDG
ncbi:MAG TPA: CDGSH iron-sulfur domain-containing protein, partial [Acidobacteriota bacterium]|nr:CDGSH iron-sulfur domain-containing protein [Acidobacteriota bacterium]